MVVYDSKNGHAEWLPDGKILVKTIKGFIYGEELKGLFNSGYDQVVKGGGVKWLSDNRNLKPYRQEDVTWINQDFLPRMLKAGWKYWAVIEPDNVLGNLSMKNFLDFYQQQGITLKIFNNKVDALAWIKSV